MIYISGENRGLGRFFEPPRPRAGPLAEMHDRNNQEGVVPDLVNDPVRKAAGAASTGALRKRMPSLGMLSDPFQRPFDFCGEFKTQAFAFGIVIGDGFLQLAGSREQEPEDHRRRLSIRLNTSRAGIAFNFPFSKASRRFSTSCAHKASIFLREGNSKLEKSFSMSSARSIGCNLKAVEKIWRL